MQQMVLYLRKENLYRTVKGEDLKDSIVDILCQFSGYDALTETITFEDELPKKEMQENGLYLVNCPIDCKFVVVDLQNPNRSYSSHHTKYRSVLEDALVRYNLNTDMFTILSQSDSELEILLKNVAAIVPV